MNKVVALLLALAAFVNGAPSPEVTSHVTHGNVHAGPHGQAAHTVTHSVTHAKHAPVHPLPLTVTHGVTHGHDVVHSDPHGHTHGAVAHVAQSTHVAHGKAPHAAGYGHNPHNGYGHNDYNAPAHYDFGYGVKDDYKGLNFGHSESRDGYITKGEYYVNLPDGRLQKVSYYADKWGYHPTVTYVGNAHFPPHHGGGGYAPVPHHQDVGYGKTHAVGYGSTHNVGYGH